MYGTTFASMCGVRSILILLLMAGCAVDASDDDVDATEAEVNALSTRAIKVLHWNISGAVLNKGANNVVDKMFDEIMAKRPDVVSINEGCRDQVEHLRKRLRSKGFVATLQFAPTGVNGACARSLGTNVLEAGPAILVLAGGKNGQSHYWKGNDSVDTRTDRGMACLTGDFGKPVRFCSLHLATADATAAAQAESMTKRWKEFFDSSPHVMIGDYNASPAYLKEHAPTLDATFVEADASRNQATHGEGKLDFIFMSKRHFAPEAQVEIRDMGSYDPWWGDRRAYSDHRLVNSTITLKL